MIVFGIIAALLSAAVAALILRGAARGAADAAAPGETPAMAMHRRELAEVDTLSERGLLADDERAVLRTEAARRLLAAADDAAVTAAPAGPADRRLVLTIAVLTPLLAAAAYFLVGAPGYPDQPYQTRLAAWRAADPASLTPPQMAAILEGMVADRPGDPEPLWALGMAQMASGQPIAAQTALRKAVDLAPERADLWATLGEFFTRDAEGVVGADAKAAFTEALKRDPSNLAARYYLGRAALADGDKPAALMLWRSIESDLPAGDPRRTELTAEIAAAETGAPAAEAVQAAAGQVGPDQIRAMVDGLAQRLAARPDDPAGWERLIRSYRVLGEDALADQAYRTATTRFIGRRDIIDALTAAHKGTAP
jgi:cytochrome c-type biogenesis protein CcmH